MCVYLHVYACIGVCVNLSPEVVPSYSGVESTFRSRVKLVLCNFAQVCRFFFSHNMLVATAGELGQAGVGQSDDNGLRL